MTKVVNYLSGNRCICNGRIL